MQVFRSLSIVLDEADLLKLVGHDSTTAEIVIEGLNLLAAQKSGLLADALQATATSEHESVRVRRLELLAETSSDHALGEITAAISNESGRHARQRAVSLLAELATDQSDEQLLLLADDLLNEIADSEIAVEVLESLELRAADNPQLANVRDQILGQLQTAGQQSIESEFSMCLTGGDADLGRQLFNTHLQAQCVRCHRIGKQGSTVGPQLDDIAAKRDLRYLLRAIVAPSADIEEKYRSLTVVLASGKTVQGLRVRETDDVLVLANNQGKEIEIEKSEIDDTVAQKVSIMPEMSKTLTPREIRDVLAYLKTLKSGR
jgi:putative heme-binding domain-containing protein